MPPRQILAVLPLLLLAGCATNPAADSGGQLSSTAGGAAVGAAAGTLVGQATGTDPRMSTLIGAGFGALSGAGIGSYMDQQEAELRTQLQSTGVSVTRAGNQIVLNMPASITFDTDKAVVKPEFGGTLVSVATVLKHFNRTIVNVYGFTDSQGSAAHDNDLSQRRAVAVATILAAHGVDQRRFYIKGRGAADPIASNDTEAGRAQNRRVEIQVSPLT